MTRFSGHALGRGASGWMTGAGIVLPPLHYTGLRDLGENLLHSLWLMVILALALAALIGLVARRLLSASRRRQDELERLVAARTAELEHLGRLTETLNSAVRLEDVLEHVYSSFRSLLPYDRIGFALVEGQPARVRAVWARGETAPSAIASGYEAPLAGSSLQRVLTTREPRVLADLEAYLEQHPESDSTRRIVEEGMRSSLTFPLVALGRPVGFLFFSSRRVRAYTDDHVRLLRQVAGEVSLILEKSRLYDDLLATKGELELANQTLARLAAEDPLTGVANRRVFEQRLDEEWRRAQRVHGPMAVLMVDVDHFKAFNDRYGHAAGDRCLVQVATALAANLRRAGDLLTRHGGEEFAVILPETTVAAASRIADVLRSAVEGLGLPHAGSPVAPHVTVSIGVAAAYPAAGGDPSSLVAAADAALYQAKAAGRNTCRGRELTGEIATVGA